VIVRLFAICILLCSAGAFATTADNYAYAWPLQTSGDGAAWQVELNAEVYAAVRDTNLRDIEVVNAAGDAVPMAPRMAQMNAATKSEIELPLFALPVAATPGTDSLQFHIERDAQGHLRRLDASESAGSAAVTSDDLILDSSALKLPIDSLWLNWDQSGPAVTAQYRVSGSDDLQQWHVLNPSASVLAMQQNGNSLSRRQITLGGAHAKYLRLERLDHGAALADLHVRARTLASPSLVQSMPVWVDAQLQLASDNPSSFTYRLPAPLAADALKLELATGNSLARVQVRSRTGAEANAWQTRAEFTAFRLHQDDGALANDEIALAPGGRAQEWRVEPATPLDRAPTLRIAYRPDRFVFLAQGGGPYRLVAGSARARRGDYPVDAALAQLRAKLGPDWQPSLAALGTRTTLQGESALVAAPRPHDWKTWILWAVLIGGTALIGGLALSLLRKPQA